MFSLIIPLYNKAPYLQRALDSVYAQRFPAGEILVVNDGSTDGGEGIAKAQGEPRVRVIDLPRGGVSRARNAGIGAATQPYLVFLDADDVWLPDFLERVREMIEACPGAALYGTGFATVAGGRVLRRYGVRAAAIQRGASGARRGEKDRPAFGPVDFFKEWSRGHVIHTSSMAVSKRAALEVGGFPEGVTHGEDLEFWAKLALSGPVVLSPEVLAQYHVDVPGQAVEYWEGAYKRDFDVLPYHRFLAQALGQCVVNTGTRRLGVGEANRVNSGAEVQKQQSFKKYARRELMMAFMQRVLGGNFRAAAEFYQGLGLGQMRLGSIIRMCGWIAEHPAAQPMVNALIRLTRGMRDMLQHGGTRARR